MCSQLTPVRPFLKTMRLMDLSNQMLEPVPWMRARACLFGCSIWCSCAGTSGDSSDSVTKNACHATAVEQNRGKRGGGDKKRGEQGAKNNRRVSKYAKALSMVENNNISSSISARTHTRHPHPHPHTHKTHTHTRHTLPLTERSIASSDARVTPDDMKRSLKSAHASLLAAVMAGRCSSQYVGAAPLPASSTMRWNCLPCKPRKHARAHGRRKRRKKKKQRRDGQGEREK